MHDGVVDRLRALSAAVTLALVAALFAHARGLAHATASKPPPTLEETGLYADFATLQIAAGHIGFSPQYPLWSDGAAKRRWLSLPPGTAIDASDPEAWAFPVGARFWKEFSFGGRRIETRYMERQADGRWLFAAYAWSADEREARLVSDQGRRGAYPLADGRSHRIPSVSDCKACHQGGRSDVLGFSALQLSPDRDPLAAHAEPLQAEGIDLDDLIAKGLLVNWPHSPERPPRIAAASPIERAALGYLHGNCGHCHNDQGPLRNLGMVLRYATGAAVAPAIATTVGQAVKKPAPGQSDGMLRIEPRNLDRSGLVQRMASRYSALQMPPLGTELVDRQAVELIERWISEMDSSGKEARHEQRGQ